MSGTELEIGAQTRAAGVIAGTIEPIRTTLSDLGNSLSGSAGGFKGSAAVGLSIALEAWFDTAGDLLPVLNEYATHLMAVDSAEARAESRQLESFARLADRLGGGQ